MKTIKCDKCDERGMIVDTYSPNYSAHSCKCGYAVSDEKIKKDIEFLKKSNLVSK